MISVIVFTFNEERNLPGCLRSLKDCDDVVVVDSFSSDRTCEIAGQYGARLFQNHFTGFGDQRNWALDSIPIKHDWILILDADERVTTSLWNEMKMKVKCATNSVAAFRMKRKYFWNGICLHHANLYPTWVVRLIHSKRVRYINRGHAETQQISGEIGDVELDLMDDNQNSIDEWRARQMKYARQEAEYEYSLRAPIVWSHFFDANPLVRREMLKAIARKIPFRGLAFWIYSYIFRLGFLDGLHGLHFCLLKSLYHVEIQRCLKELQKSRQA